MGRVNNIGLISGGHETDMFLKKYGFLRKRDNFMDSWFLFKENHTMITLTVRLTSNSHYILAEVYSYKEIILNNSESEKLHISNNGNEKNYKKFILNNDNDLINFLGFFLKKEIRIDKINKIIG